jgi:hypothetical protein
MRTTYDLRINPDDLIAFLLASHHAESDVASKPLADLLRQYGEVVASKGVVGQDYAAIIAFDGSRWLVEDNNAWTRIYSPTDADYDVDAELGIVAE